MVLPFVPVRPHLLLLLLRCIVTAVVVFLRRCTLTFLASFCSDPGYFDKWEYEKLQWNKFVGQQDELSAKAGSLSIAAA